MQQTFVLHTQKNVICTAYSKKHVICTAYSKKRHLYCVLKKALKQTFVLHTKKSTSFVLRTQKSTQKVGKKRWQKRQQKNTPKKHIATYTIHMLIIRKKLLKAYS